MVASRPASVKYKEDKMKVYIGKTSANETIIDVNPQVLKDAEILLTVPLEEYQSLGHRSVEVVFEDGKAVLKLKEPAATQKKVDKIDAELEALDSEYLTPRILAGASTGDEYALGQIALHNELAGPLRTERKLLTG